MLYKSARFVKLFKKKKKPEMILIIMVQLKMFDETQFQKVMKENKNYF